MNGCQPAALCPQLQRLKGYLNKPLSAGPASPAFWVLLIRPLAEFGASTFPEFFAVSVAEVGPALPPNPTILLNPRWRCNSPSLTISSLQTRSHESTCSCQAASRPRTLHGAAFSNDPCSLAAAGVTPRLDQGGPQSRQLPQRDALPSCPGWEVAAARPRGREHGEGMPVKGEIGRRAVCCL